LTEHKLSFDLQIEISSSMLKMIPAGELCCEKPCWNSHTNTF